MQMVLNTSNFSSNESAAIITKPVRAEKPAKGEQAKQHQRLEQTNQSQHAEARKHVTSARPNTIQTTAVQFSKSAALLGSNVHVEKVETRGAFSSITDLVIRAVIVLFLIALILLLWQNNCSLWRTVDEIKEHPKDLVNQFSDGKAKQAAGQIGYDLTHPDQQPRRPATCC